MHILLVEDNPSDVRLLKDLMEEQGYQPSLHWVMDGHEALDYVMQKKPYGEATRPDIILLDLGLPRISGYDVLRKLKKDAKYAKIPIVILTTSRDPLDQKQCATLGADAFLSKPRNLKEYELLVEKLVHEYFPHLVQAVH